MRSLSAAVVCCVVVTTGAARAQCEDGSPRCLPWSNVLNGEEYYPPFDPETFYVPPDHYSFRWSPPGSADEVWAGSVSFFVEQSDTYTIEIASDEIPLALALYERSFDPTKPSDQLVASLAETPSLAGEYRGGVGLRLTAGVVYYVVVSATTSEDYGLYEVDVSGPGSVLLNSCFSEPDELHPAIHVFDPESGAIDIQGFCVVSWWRDYEDRRGRGTATGFRTRDSAVFWFFRPDNWELNVKILDGCAINGRYWVLLSASTDVEYDLAIFQTFKADKIYDNELGELSPARIDVDAIDCPE